MTSAAAQSRRPLPVRLWGRIRGRLWGDSLFWRDSLWVRLPARKVRRALSLAAYRWRVWRGGSEPPRIVADLIDRTPAPLPHPAITVLADEAAALLASQTETSIAVDAPGAAYWLSCDGLSCDGLSCDGDGATLPPSTVESLLLAVAAEGLAAGVAGWTLPAAGRFGPSGKLAPGASARLVRLIDGEVSPLVGRYVGHVTDRAAAQDAAADAGPLFGVVPSGPYLLHPEVRPGQIVRSQVVAVDQALRTLPQVPGPRSALFLLPFLAVGGAERLLFDLLAGLRPRYRLLIVTLEPHLAHRGQTVDAARELTPHVYTLGDWLPRAAYPGALRHLLRRYQVETLVSWNGTVDFYDHATAISRDLPGLRILHQLYNHEGGWIERCSPTLNAAVDLHLAVNQRIADALADRGVPAERVEVVHHGVRVPPLPSPEERAARRRERRRQLGLPEDRVVVGTFIRLHPQKRPLDVVHLARRMADRPVHFLLVGGGPADAEVDRELARHPLPNLTRLPLHREVEPLYDALDLCLMTSSYEGLPVFLLDGLARQIPCVTTAVGEIPELLATGGGVLVDRPGDLAALQAGVERLLDPARRAAEGERGRATVAARFGLATYRARYERLIFQPPPDESRQTESRQTESRQTESQEDQGE